MRSRLAVVAPVATVTLALVAAAPTWAQERNTDLIAKHVSWQFAALPAAATASTSASTVDGYRGVRLYLEDRSGTAVTNASVTVDSGYDASLFYWNGPVGSFPATRSIARVAPGTVWDVQQGLTSAIQARFAAGYDSTRTEDATTIPPGGGRQTVTVTVTPRDDRYEAPELYGQFNIIVDSELPGVTVDSWTGPSNVDQGEEVFTPTPPEGSLFQWQLLGDRPHRDKPYRFTIVLNVPNASASPIEFRPEVSIDGALETPLGDVKGDEVSLPDRALDGGSPSRGGSVFHVAETTHTWSRIVDEAATTAYSATLPIPQRPVSVSVAGDTRQPLDDKISLRITAKNEDLLANASGSVSVPGASKTHTLGAIKNRLVGRGTRATLRLRVPTQLQKAIRRALRRHKQVNARIRLRAHDLAGNSATRSRTIKLTR